MITLRNFDESTPIGAQLGHEGDEPVTLVNVFHVPPDRIEAFLDAFQADAQYFKGQRGFISAQMHRGIAGSTTFLNYAVWQDIGAFRAAFSNPDFQARLASYPDGTTASPYLFHKLAVEGICVS